MTQPNYDDFVARLDSDPNSDLKRAMEEQRADEFERKLALNGPGPQMTAMVPPVVPDPSARLTVHANAIDAPASGRLLPPAPPTRQAPGPAGVADPLLAGYIEDRAAKRDALAKPAPAGIGSTGKIDAARVSDARNAAQIQEEINDADVLKRGTEGALIQREGTREQNAATIYEAEKNTRDEELRTMRHGYMDMQKKMSEGDIEPHRAWDNAGVFGKGLMILGGIIGGAIPEVGRLMGRLHLSDEEEVQKQRESYERGQKYGESVNNMFGHLVQQNRNLDLSGLESLNVMKTARIKQIEGLVASIGTEEAKARGKMLVNDITKQQHDLERQIQAERERQANASAAARLAASEREWQHRKDVSQSMRENRQLDIQAEAAGAKKRDLSDGEKIQLESDEFNRQMDNIKISPVLDGLGLGAAFGAMMPQRLDPESNKLVADLNEINTQMQQAIGRVAKDADGKPNKEMIERLEHRFEILPGDTKEIAVAKLEGVRQAVNALDRQRGANAPVPNKPVAAEVQRVAPGVRFTDASR